MRNCSATRAKAWRVRRNKVVPEKATPPKICYWNSNGLGCVLKQQPIAEVMEMEQIDLWMTPTSGLVQTMIWASSVPGLNTTENKVIVTKMEVEKMRIQCEVRIITNYSSLEGIAQFAILWLKFEHWTRCQISHL